MLKALPIYPTVLSIHLHSFKYKYHNNGVHYFLSVTEQTPKLSNGTGIICSSDHTYNKSMCVTLQAHESEDTCYGYYNTNRIR